MYVDKVVLILIAVWLTGLSVGLFLFFKFFQRLTRGTKEISLVKNLTKILEQEGILGQEIKTLTKRLERLEESGIGHLQKMALVRFNPFSETGGDHSFSLALLNGNDTGIVITGLHTRERTRVYIKSIKVGKSEIELSNEEKKAIDKAKVA